MTKLHEVKFPAECKSLPDGFWSAVDVWIKKPHVVNKRLCGATETPSEEVGTENLGVLLDPKSTDSHDVLSFLTRGQSTALTHDQENTWTFSVRTFIPKVNCYGSTSHKEFVLKDFDRLQVTFVPFEEDASGEVCQKIGNVYQISLVQRDNEEWFLELRVLAAADWACDGVAYPRLVWLCSTLLPRLLRWAAEPAASQFKSTLSLLPVEKYGCVYQQLKEKYRAMVKVWPEVTDPEKFVYEDVAIATYLLVLWGEERAERGVTEKQSFVDLGCGNGLLVHILSNEGHPGKGIDVRRRKIWDMYGPQTCLEEKAITPGEGFLFPATDWLIGNHSDELTPWIPVMAARSSFACRYFVLPCCFFDFYGKFQRRRCGTSQYKEYIDYIAEVSRASGFHTDEDCLRIPSTKRVCLVGKSRSYAPCDAEQAEERRASYIQSRRSSSGSGSGSVVPPRPPSVADGDGGDHDDGGGGGGGEGPGDGEHGGGGGGGGGYHDNGDPEPAGPPGNDWGAGFQPRERVEKVRNCAALPRDFVDGVVLRVAKALLGLAEDDGGPPTPTPAAAADVVWNPGESMSVREVAELLDHGTLLRLKSECGGLQTLLKNNHQVFRVEGGRVHIRDWRAGSEERGRAESKRGRPVASGALKTRSCWFHSQHPQGCPLEAAQCCFAHGPQDLRPSTKPLKKMKWSAV
ncbi:putative tRNA (uracil-O(2)-)-methyltransferase [Gadus morhua]|uniref:tRNA (uracil-O(2)-)-methyltransferase n=1 Tax=Gadus morhua TaxID=8049 RepID=A0A8C4Z8C3_GADMO|nr:probable tRNA (uracil-O(2)-)-methyltransferase [Gadus morhua]